MSVNLAAAAAASCIIPTNPSPREQVVTWYPVTKAKTVGQSERERLPRSDPTTREERKD